MLVTLAEPVKIGEGGGGGICSDFVKEKRKEKLNEQMKQKPPQLSQHLAHIW